MRDQHGAHIAVGDIVGRRATDGKYRIGHVQRLLRMPDLQEGVELRAFTHPQSSWQQVVFSEALLTIVCQDFRTARSDWLLNLYPEFGEALEFAEVQGLALALSAIKMR